MKNSVSVCLLTLVLYWGAAGVSAAANEGATANPGTHSGVGASGEQAQVKVAVLSGAAVFNTNSNSLSQQGIVAMNKLIDDLGDFSDILSIRITGHTDSVGNAEYNQILSEKRATFIQELFVERFPEINVIAIGAGETSPVASNSTAAGRLKNRRVEIQVVAAGIKP